MSVLERVLIVVEAGLVVFAYGLLAFLFSDVGGSLLVGLITGSVLAAGVYVGRER